MSKGLTCCKNLKTLHLELGENNLHDLGIVELANAMKNNLTEIVDLKLDLKNNHIKYLGAQALADCFEIIGS